MSTRLKLVLTAGLLLVMIVIAACVREIGLPGTTLTPMPAINVQRPSGTPYPQILPIRPTDTAASRGIFSFDVPTAAPTPCIDSSYTFTTTNDSAPPGDWADAYDPFYDYLVTLDNADYYEGTGSYQYTFEPDTAGVTHRVAAPTEDGQVCTAVFNFRQNLSDPQVYNYVDVFRFAGGPGLGIFPGTGLLRMYQGDLVDYQWIAYTGTIPIASETWYTITLSYKRGADGWMRSWVNDALDIDESSINTVVDYGEGACGNTTCAGTIFYVASGAVWFDDVQVTCGDECGAPTPTPTVLATPTVWPTKTPRPGCSDALTLACPTLDPTVDGGLTEWITVTGHTVDNATYEFMAPLTPTPSPANASGTFYCAHDATTLHLAGIITDTLIISSTSASLANGDAAEIGVDAFADGLYAPRLDDHELTISPGNRVADYLIYPLSHTSAVTLTAAVWQFELDLAAADLGGHAVTAGQEMCLSFGVIDNDTGGNDAWQRYLWGGWLLAQME